MTEHPHDPEADIPTRRRSDLHRPPPVPTSAPATAPTVASPAAPTAQAAPSAEGGHGIPPAEPPTKGAGWVSRNKWGLILLPVAIVVALMAASDRMVTFWYGDGPHDATTAEVGESVDLRQGWQDVDGKHVREVTVTVTGIAPTTVAENYEGEDEEAVIPGADQLWRVSLDFAADPDRAPGLPRRRHRHPRPRVLVRVDAHQEADDRQGEPLPERR